MISELVGKLTNVCWDKCITSNPGSKFSSGETACLTNCAQRYMDMSIIIMKRFQSMQWDKLSSAPRLPPTPKAHFFPFDASTVPQAGDLLLSARLSQLQTALLIITASIVC
ncbi:Mitochondrial import inner membrane translocase subunit TIM8 [Platanthera guangdongensis]|uniref:Mitochondrial import inner membrane translocase subunit n=1 Tax=Platanthera guangdongensis TaxID=2320717 RepID=A0ABR2LXV6_9ASPA